MNKRIGLGILACISFGSAHGACSSPEHRAFDFWLGDWEVRTADGKLAGTNRIETAQNGCVIHESYSTPRGYNGQSLNIYDTSRKVWHQTWVDTDGLLLQLEGGLRDGKMVMEGAQKGADGKITKQRITWTPNKDGSVRQLWETIDEKGVKTVAFDGLYTKK